MTDPTPRVWLLPNGNVITSFEVCGTKTRYEEHYVIDQRTTSVREIHYYDELPEEAVPLVAIPAEEAHREGDYIRVACGDQYRYTPERAVEQVEYLTRELGHALAVQEFLKRESTSVEAARRKVLQDLKPGVYAVTREPYQDIWLSKTCAGYVTPDGRLMVCRNNPGEVEDCTEAYPAEGWSYHLLAEGDLSPAVSE